MKGRLGRGILASSPGNADTRLDLACERSEDVHSKEDGTSVLLSSFHYAGNDLRISSSTSRKCSASRAT